MLDGRRKLIRCPVDDVPASRPPIRALGVRISRRTRTREGCIPSKRHPPRGRQRARPKTAMTMAPTRNGEEQAQKSPSSP